MKTYPLVPIATGWRLQALPKELVDRSNKCIDFSQQRKKSLTSTLELEQQSTGKEPWPSWSQTCLPGCFDSLYMLSASCRSSEPESPWNYTLHTAANKPYKWPAWATYDHLWSKLLGRSLQQHIDNGTYSQCFRGMTKIIEDWCLPQLVVPALWSGLVPRPSKKQVLVTPTDL